MTKSKFYNTKKTETSGNDYELIIHKEQSSKQEILVSWQMLKQKGGGAKCSNTVFII